MASAAVAEKLKEKGNALFKDGQYEDAAECYTEAIQRYSRNPLLFTNRANCRLKLQQEITGSDQNFKAHFYLAQAQFALNHPNEALSSALKSYEQVMALGSQSKKLATTKSIPAIVALVVRCRKAKFEIRQRDRQQRQGDLLAELEFMMEVRKRTELDEIAQHVQDGTMAVIEADERRNDVLQTAQGKINELRSAFAVADPCNHALKEVPDWAIDTISFELIHDPVVTISGHSYERATIMEHLTKSSTDPLTRAKLTADDLRPNIALKKALEDFWENAGNWAIDW